MNTGRCRTGGGTARILVPVLSGAAAVVSMDAARGPSRNHVGGDAVGAQHETLAQCLRNFADAVAQIREFGQLSSPTPCSKYSWRQSCRNSRATCDIARAGRPPPARHPQRVLIANLESASRPRGVHHRRQHGLFGHQSVDRWGSYANATSLLSGDWLFATNCQKLELPEVSATRCIRSWPLAFLLDADANCRTAKLRRRPCVRPRRRKKTHLWLRHDGNVQSEPG